MANRPGYIDLGASRSMQYPSSAATSPGALPSPRSGDVPPALSPLDAFAMQSLQLAKRLEESKIDGHRMSRLPPHTIASELAKVRNGYFTPRFQGSGSSDDHVARPERDSGLADTAMVEHPEFRPMSMYPSIQAPDDERPESSRAFQDNLHPLPRYHQKTGSHDSTSMRFLKDYSAAPRTASPEPFPGKSVTTERNVHMDRHIPPDSNSFYTPTSLHPSAEFIRRSPPPMPKKQWTGDSLRSTDSSMLHPPRSPAFSRSPRSPPSIRSVQVDSGDDSDSVSFHESRGRPPPSHAWTARPHSPFSPIFAPRSSSISSEQSVTGVRTQRQSLNYSRPISRTGQRPSTETAYQYTVDNSSAQQVVDSPQLRPSIDVLSIPESLDSPGFAPESFVEASEIPPFEDFQKSHQDDELGPKAAPSYIYAKYSLPRGRILSRESMIMPDNATHVFSWEQSMVARSDSPSLEHLNIQPHSIHQSQTQPLIQQPFEHTDPASLSSHNRTQSADLPITGSSNRSLSIPRPSTTSTSSASTERPRSSTPTSATRRSDAAKPAPLRSRDFFAPITHTRSESMTPEEHLAQGISCHQEGSLQKSTYHLRLAARAGNPTGMLLYALACRHGWGMRPNASEGVTWLRKAVEGASQEVAWDEESVAAALARQKDGTSSIEQTNGSVPPDVLARKTHKAQFALSVYELGVSYMNGWGITQDRALALRCFEIAGNWGDGDALAEAGFCYAKGVGCKKDLRKAAELYRGAEKRGVEMAGNSWIYKEKYMKSSAGTTKTSGDTTERKGRGKDKDKDEKEKKPRDKSRTRTIFGGRKRTNTVVGASTSSIEPPVVIPDIPS